jgi:hypothetical protein
LLGRKGKAKTEKADPEKKRALDHERIHSGKASSASKIFTIHL